MRKQNVHSTSQWNQDLLLRRSTRKAAPCLPLSEETTPPAHFLVRISSAATSDCLSRSRQQGAIVSLSFALRGHLGVLAPLGPILPWGCGGLV